MEKVIAAFDARRQFGTVIQDVVVKGDRFVVERHGTPVAALVPIEVYEQWKQQRQAFFDQLRQAASQTNLSEQEASDLATEAVQAVRHETI
jgi:prevent-host-death family protein